MKEKEPTVKEPTAIVRRKIAIDISLEQEFLLMEKFGRKCSRETLIHRAIDQVVPVKKVKRPRKGSPTATPKVKTPPPTNQPDLLSGNGETVA